MKKTKFLYVAIILLAIVLRLYQLGEVPVALEWDEVAIGYDAYSLLKTGRDQFGKFLPSTFRSLDDYKPPIYEYLAIPTIAFFGLNSFSVRLPSAFFGILAVVVTYKLAFIIFSQLSTIRKKASYLSLLPSFLLAISPWHLQFSRAAFEVNIAVFITIAAVISFLIGLKRPRFFLLSAVLFGLDLFSYHSARVVAVVLMASLFLLFNKQLPKRQYLMLFFFIFGIFFLSFIPILLSPQAQIRFKATNIFNPGARYLDEKDLPKIFLEKRLQDKNAGYELAGRIFHNQRLIFTDYDTLKKAFSNYLSHFGFEYLFIRGDAPLHHAPGFGLLHLWELPFLIFGFVYLLVKSSSRYGLLVLIWMFLAPIPSSVTREAPHAVRSELFLPTFQLITSLGLVIATKKITRESSWVFILFAISASVLLLLNHSYYLHQYYVHTNYELSENWKYGRQKAVEFTEKVKNNYDKVLVSLKVDMPYIFWLFYSKYPPEKYLAEGGTVSGGFADERNHFDKYEFRNFDYNNLPREQKLLLVSTPDNFPSGAKIVKTIRYLNGTKALIIAESR